jgi:hypothetical protein
MLDPYPSQFNCCSGKAAVQSDQRSPTARSVRWPANAAAVNAPTASIAVPCLRAKTGSVGRIGVRMPGRWPQEMAERRRSAGRSQCPRSALQQAECPWPCRCRAQPAWPRHCTPVSRQASAAAGAVPRRTRSTDLEPVSVMASMRPRRHRIYRASGIMMIGRAEVFQSTLFLPLRAELKDSPGWPCSQWRVDRQRPFRQHPSATAGTRATQR